jgi:nicotinate-nucleotide adenylyltransferase
MGGSFDPLHLGHLGVAREAKRLLQLDEMRLLPCYLSPHKEISSSSIEHRINLIQACLKDEAGLTLDLREAQSRRQIYSVDTLKALRHELGEQTCLVFVVGSDSWLSLPSWHRWRSMFDLCNFAIVPRPGYVADLPEELEQELASRELVVERLCDYSAGHYTVLETDQWDVSSTQLRAKLKRGEDVSTLLPQAGLNYIQKHHLYQ